MMLPSDAIVVLGCRVHAGGSVRGALERRVDRAADAYHEGRAPRLVVSGGRVWGDAVEADAMARALEARGVPAAHISRERCSMSTKDNARFAARLLGRLRLERVIVVTCPWHLTRALLLFHREGIQAEGLGAEPGDATAFQRLYRAARERVCMRLDGVKP
jgi:uncharacterized SAM-binding protein YcdF (DUF218 family)